MRVLRLLLLCLLLVIAACRPLSAAVPAPTAAASVTPPPVPTAAPPAPAEQVLPITLPWQGQQLPVSGVAVVPSAAAALAAQYGTAAATVSTLTIGTPDAPLLTIGDGIVNAAGFSRRFACAVFLVAFDPGSSALISVLPLDDRRQPCAAALQFNPAPAGGLQLLTPPPVPTLPPPADQPDPAAAAVALRSGLLALEQQLGSGPFALVAVAARGSTLHVLALTPDGPLHLFVQSDPAAEPRVIFVTLPPLDLDRLQAAGIDPGLAFAPPAVEATALSLLLAARAERDQSLLFSYRGAPTADAAEAVMSAADGRLIGTAVWRDGSWTFVSQ